MFDAAGVLVNFFRGNFNIVEFSEIRKDFFSESI